MHLKLSRAQALSQETTTVPASVRVRDDASSRKWPTRMNTSCSRRTSTPSDREGIMAAQQLADADPAGAQKLGGALPAE
jgi:hypothetical protein